jgi:hypothetical protein
VQETQLLKEGGADKSVEVAAGDEAIGAVQGQSGSRHAPFVDVRGRKLEVVEAPADEKRGH